MNPLVQTLIGDCRAVLPTLPDESVQCCVTSPPYWGLRDYGHKKQIGQEKTPEEYVAHLVACFREVRRVLRGDGTLWLNLGDSYANGVHGMPVGRARRATGLKAKDLVGIPWRVAFALQADGWYLRQDIIWAKPNPMPESVTDRCTKAHEYIFLLSKLPRYYYDAESIKEPVAPSQVGRVREDVIGGNKGDLIHHSAGGVYATAPKSWNGSKFDGERDLIVRPTTGRRSRGNGKWHKENVQSSGRRLGENVQKARDEGGEHDTPFGETRNKRSVWTVPTNPYAEAHFATFPPDLIKPCILAGVPLGGVVLDPFGGSGTTGLVAVELGRRAILIELNPEYGKLIEQRTNVTPGLAL